MQPTRATTHERELHDGMSMTADELLALPRGRDRYELVNGRLHIMAPAGHEHGDIAGNAYFAVRSWAESKGKPKVGICYAAETGFRLSELLVCAPDAAFVTIDRATEVAGEPGYFPGPPDLAVEVVSPRDSYTEVEDKMTTWLQHGVQVVWIIEPRDHTVTVHMPGQPPRILHEADTLEGGNLLPGFAIVVRELFS